MIILVKIRVPMKTSECFSENCEYLFRKSLFGKFFYWKFSEICVKFVWNLCLCKFMCEIFVNFFCDFYCEFLCENFCEHFCVKICENVLSVCHADVPVQAVGAWFQWGPDVSGEETTHVTRDFSSEDNSS